MKQICIGVYVHAEPQRLRDTLCSLRANTQAQFDLLLLPDGPDAVTNSSLRSLTDIQQSGTAEPRGTAACFNRLAAETDADVLVLLESGVQVGDGWLGFLVSALNADPRNGLAGPSTNHSWNEQCVYSHTGGRTDQIASTAKEAVQRFGSEVTTLDPLYSLADFCYVVRREVIETIGAADESYGPGPCWEMDYNIRAARAGWRGVWAKAAYVHRAPFTARRRLEEARRFEFSKHRYQDKFCGGRLRGEMTDYRTHCRGDACSNFAPAALIELKRPLPPAQPIAVAPPATELPIIVSAKPLVSCIMPTCNRRSFVLQAIRCFLRQDYPNLELVIIDDGTDPIADCIPDDEHIHYFRLDQKQKLGAKRNYACERSRGEFIVHWDDDDWYPSWRVSKQIDVLSERGFDLCGSSRVHYFDADRNLAWEYRYAVAGPKWVAGNTLAYRKTLWERNKFPEIQIGEDSRFVWGSAHSMIHDLADPSLCVATAHAGNTSRKEVGGSCWHAQSTEIVRSLLGDDVHFYCRADRTEQTALPMVSCIMPTYNRRQFVPQALRLFLSQDYPNRELIIVDDGPDAIEDLVTDLPNVSYLRLLSRTSIGAKRNLACRHAQGDFIAHWDDDDWYSIDRLRYQLAPILSGEADMTGLENALVLVLPAGEFWKTDARLHQRLFVGNVHGGTLVYRKELLTQGLRYPEINLAEDAYLLHYAVRRGKRLVRLANPGVFVYVRHDTNAWREFKPGHSIDPAGWERITPDAVFPKALLQTYRIERPE